MNLIKFIGSYVSARLAAVILAGTVLLIAVLIFSALLHCDGGPDCSIDTDDSDWRSAHRPRQDDDDDTDDVYPFYPARRTYLPYPFEQFMPQGEYIENFVGLATEMGTEAETDWQQEIEIDSVTNDLGINKMRVQFAWSSVEPVRNQWDFETTDLLADQPVEWIAQLGGAPDWAMPDGSPSEIDPELFADYAYAIADRYCDTIKQYEIWNEPNNHVFWEPQPDPEHYFQMLKASYASIKMACPDAEVILGGLSSTNLPQEISVGTYEFLGEIGWEHADFCDHFDAVAMHPYTLLDQFPPEWNDFLGDWDFNSFSLQISAVEVRLGVFGCREKPIYMTEFGWPDTYLGQDRQAAFLLRALLISVRWGVDGAFWRTFWDMQGREPQTENDFGLVEYTESPEEIVQKPAFDALQFFVEILEGSRFAGVLSEYSIGCDNVGFLDDTHQRVTIAAWNGDSGEPNCTLKIPQPTISSENSYFDAFGEPITPDLEDDETIEFTVGGMPIYLVLEFDSANGAGFVDSNKRSVIDGDIPF